ncbi:MAG: hypothetical protein CMQ29_06750 [Gammaproteobacteria bacterium]|nr:hypothetical protein [Gammaproteobacteria bacterium]
MSEPLSTRLSKAPATMVFAGWNATRSWQTPASMMINRRTVEQGALWDFAVGFAPLFSAILLNHGARA